jgi:hypothetical protein
MILHHYSRKQPCYFCGAPGPSKREHVPPQMMFECFDCDSITVPSCHKHNTEKSIGDRAIVTAISMSASQMLKYQSRINRRKIKARLTSNVIKAIKYLEPDFDWAKNQVRLQRPLIDPPEGLDIPLPFTQSYANIVVWIKQLTAALIWSVTGRYEPSIQWDDSLAWSPGFIPTNGPLTTEYARVILWDYDDFEKELNKLVWLPGWSAEPKKYPEDIFAFDLFFPENVEKYAGMNVIFRHRFYNSISVWFVWFRAPQETITVLKAICANKVDGPASK